MALLCCFPKVTENGASYLLFLLLGPAFICIFSLPHFFLAQIRLFFPAVFPQLYGHRRELRWLRAYTARKAPAPQHWHITGLLHSTTKSPALLLSLFGLLFSYCLSEMLFLIPFLRAVGNQSAFPPHAPILLLTSHRLVSVCHTYLYLGTQRWSLVAYFCCRC